MTEVAMAWERHQSVGGYGYTVTLIERTPGRLSLRFGSPHQWRALGHGDWDRGLREARELAGQLLAGAERLEVDRSTMRQLIGRYQQEESAQKKAPQARDERRMADTWVAFLPIDAKPQDMIPELMRRFARARREGSIVLPLLRRGQVVRDENGQAVNRLRPNPTDTTIGHDIAFLQFVLGWAHRKGFIRANPLYQFQRPETAQPRRPVASYDRYLAVIEASRTVDPSGRFAVFMACVEGLGWRRGALCRLHSTDIDRKARSAAPWGRIRKRASSDKQRVEMWIPLPQSVREALDTLPVIGAAYIFPSPKHPHRPWRGEYARDLLERCEAAAGLEPLEGGDFHPYRRKWATERKSLPAADVMAAGGWRDRKTLEKSYQQVDPETLLAVMSETRKLREAK